MLERTRCDALMIGRGSVINPFIFHQIKAHFLGKPFQPQWEDLLRYFDVYLAEIPADAPTKIKLGKLKQLLGFFFKGNEELLKSRAVILTSQVDSSEALMDLAIPLLQKGWS